MKLHDERVCVCLCVCVCGGGGGGKVSADMADMLIGGDEAAR